MLILTLLPFSSIRHRYYRITDGHYIIDRHAHSVEKHKEKISNFRYFVYIASMARKKEDKKSRVNA